MKRPLFVITTSDYGGTETYLRQLVQRLDRRRFEPVVCSLCALGRLGEQIAAAGIETFSLDMAAGTRPLALASGVWRLRREIDRRRIDLVVGLLYRANMLAALAGRISKRRPPVVCGQRSLNPTGQRLMVSAVRATRGLCCHVIAVSPAVRDEILATERYPAERISVLRNGVDTERWQRDDLKARQIWQLPDSALVICAAGRLMPVKGFHHLIDAVAALRGSDPDLDLRLLIAGDGSESKHLEEKAAEHRLESRVRLVGRLSHDQLRTLYSASDIYALSSKAEGSPNAMLEAMACGCAVVATAVGGVPDIVEEGRSGLLIAPEDPRALAAALRRLARDPELLADLATGARQRIEHGFSLERMVADHEALLGRLLGTR